MKYPVFFRHLAPLILALFCLACERSAQTLPEEMEISIQKDGKLELSSKKNFPRTIYIDISDSTGSPPLTPEYLPRLLAQDNFEVVDNPSKAAYILHIFLLKEGRTDPQNLGKLVKAGYDSKAEFSGDGISAWLADALLVSRRVPEARRESRVRLENISSRNALGSSQMRLAISCPDRLEGRDAFAHAFAQPLAQTIREALNPQTVNIKKEEAAAQPESAKK